MMLAKLHSAARPSGLSDAAALLYLQSNLRLYDEI